MRNLLKTTILYPSGNETVLIQGIPKSEEVKRKINDLIMSKFDSVEQVGFYDLLDKRLEMAGGEFCVNASRAFVYLLNDAGLDIDYIQVSGVNKKLKAGVSKKGEYYVEAPFLTKDFPKKIKSKMEEILLEGITLLVVSDEEESEESKLKVKAEDILEKYGYKDKYPASGVIYLSKLGEGKYEISPVIWVRDIETCFFETACGSGTAAAGISEALKVEGNDLFFEILQPSGKYLGVRVFKKNNSIKYVEVSGEVELVKRLDIKMQI